MLFSLTPKNAVCVPYTWRWNHSQHSFDLIDWLIFLLTVQSLSFAIIELIDETDSRMSKQESSKTATQKGAVERF